MSEREALTASLRDVRARFGAAVEPIRPELHRYCSRMTGSVLDGEDLVQETLAQALYRLTLQREEVPLRPLLFTIAHHKCVDLLRSRAARATVELDEANEPIAEVDVDIDERLLASAAFSHLLQTLPPRERAAVVLKEVLGQSLPEIAATLETSVGAVKAALHRGREKLAAHDAALPQPRGQPLPAAVSAYVEAFNRRDWPLLQSLFEDDVRCELVGFVHHAGRAAVQSNYLTNYAGLSYPWKLVVAEIDGEPAIVCFRERGGEWTPQHAVRIEWRGDRIARIRDYVHVPYLLDGAHVVVTKGSAT